MTVLARPGGRRPLGNGRGNPDPHPHADRGGQTHLPGVAWEVINSIEFSGCIAPVVEEKHVTVVMVSHDGLVDEYVDEVLQLRDGQIA